MTLHLRTLLTGALALCTVAQAAAQLYFTDIFWPDFSTGKLSRINTDGTGFTPLVNTGGGTRGLDVDVVGGKMYWADVDNLFIKRANLDGSGQENIITLTPGKESPFPSALAVHRESGKLYWGDQTLGTMNRSNLDGTNQEVLFSTPFHRGLAIDHANGKVYWDTSTSDLKGEILKCDLDGSNREVVVSSLDKRFKPNKLALDIAGGKIYWTDYVVDIVRRSNLDGTGIQDLYVPPFNRNPQGITLDLSAGMVYWGQDIEIEGHTGKIMAMGLDGTGSHDFLDGFGHVNEILFVVPEPAANVVLAVGAIGLMYRRTRHKR